MNKHDSACMVAYVQVLHVAMHRVKKRERAKSDHSILNVVAIFNFFYFEEAKLATDFQML